MGRTCRICCRQRPSEQFHGKGQGASVCKKCRKRPKSEQQRILATDEVLGFLIGQRNISAKNIQRLEKLETIDDEKFQSLRTLALEIAHAKPHKRGRPQFILANHPDLYRRATEFGLFADFNEDLEFRELESEELEYDHYPVFKECNYGDPPF